jgi:hypothetical protein
LSPWFSDRWNRPENVEGAWGDSIDSEKDDKFKWTHDKTEDESSWGTRRFQAGQALKVAGLSSEELSGENAGEGEVDEEEEDEEDDEYEDDEDQDEEDKDEEDEDEDIEDYNTEQDDIRDEEDEDEHDADEDDEDEDSEDEENQNEIFLPHWAGVGKELFHCAPGTSIKGAIVSPGIIRNSKPIVVGSISRG